MTSDLLIINLVSAAVKRSTKGSTAEDQPVREQAGLPSPGIKKLQERNLVVNVDGIRRVAPPAFGREPWGEIFALRFVSIFRHDGIDPKSGMGLSQVGGQESPGVLRIQPFHVFQNMKITQDRKQFRFRVFLKEIADGP